MKRKRTLREIEHLFPKIKGAAQEALGERLGEVILYGSFARNQATEDSDIDIAVILRDDCNAGEAMSKLNDVISDLGLEFNELISILPLCRKEIENSKWPLYGSLREQGLKL